MTFGFPPKKLDDVGVCFPVPGDHSENSSYYILGRTHPIILLACPTIIFPLTFNNIHCCFKNMKKSDVILNKL